MTVETYRQISPYLRRGLYHKAQFSMKPRIIFDYELLYLEKGQMLVQIEGIDHHLKAGQLLLVKPGKYHIIRTIGDEVAWMPHIHFDLIEDELSPRIPVNFKVLEQCTIEEKAYIREDLLSSAPFNFPDIMSLHNHKDILHLVRKLITLDRHKACGDELKVKSMIIQLISEIHKGLNTEKEQDLYIHNKELEDTAEFILTHYNKRIPLETLAKQACLSVYHYQRLFKKKYGVTPGEFQIRYRLTKAKEMMVYTQMSIADIGIAVGYQQLSSFSKAFKGKEGMSPREYRKTMIM